MCPCWCHCHCFGCGHASQYTTVSQTPLQLLLAVDVAITIYAGWLLLIFLVWWCSRCTLLMLLPLLLVSLTCFAAVLPIPLQLSLAVVIAISLQPVNCWFIFHFGVVTLVWHGSHVCLSYADATALLSASLPIAVPQYCWHPVAVKGPSQLLFFCMLLHQLILLLRVLLFQLLSALSVHLLSLLPLLLLLPSSLVFYCCQFLWQSMLLTESCWKLFKQHCLCTIPQYGAVCRERGWGMRIESVRPIKYICDWVVRSLVQDV